MLVLYGILWYYTVNDIQKEKNMKSEYKKITFRLKIDLVERLKQLSKDTGASQTFLVSKAIEKMLDELKAENEK